jgi:hypothetical protein
VTESIFTPTSPSTPPAHLPPWDYTMLAERAAQLESQRDRLLQATLKQAEQLDTCMALLERLTEAVEKIVGVR